MKNSETKHFSTISTQKNNIKFSDILNLEEIQRIQDLFSDATGVASILTMIDGTPITKPSNFCRLCEIVRSNEKGRANCLKSDSFIGSKGYCLKRTELVPCLSAGLMDASASITVDGKLLANWLIGQVRNEKIDEQHILKYADEIGVDKAELLDAYHQVRVMSAEKFKKVTEMLSVFANQLSEKAYYNYQLKKEIEEKEIANELLHKSEEALTITLQSIGDGVISTDKNGFIVNINPAAEKLCGWRLTEAIGKPLTVVFNIVNSETKVRIANPVSKVIESGKIIELASHSVLVSKDGSEHYISNRAAPIKNNDGIISGVVLVFSDETKRYDSEAILRESERSKSVLLSNMPGMAYRCAYDRDWTMEFVSEGCFDLTGYKESDFIQNKNLSFNDIILPEYRDHLWDMWENAVITRKPIKEEYRIQTADNQIKWVWEQGIPIFGKSGEVVALEGLIIDITDRKNVEEALRESELYLKETQEIAHIGTYALDIITNKWTTSLLLDSILGIQPNSEKSFNGWFSVIHPEWRDEIQEYFTNQVLKRKNKFNKTFKIIRLCDKEERWVHGMGEPIFSSDNQVIKLFGTIQDITEIKNAEIALKISEEKYRTIFENVQDIFFQIDLNGNINEVSPSIKYYSNISREELIGKHVRRFYVNPSDGENVINEIFKKGGVRDFEMDLNSGDGNIKHISINAQLVSDRQGYPCYYEGAVRDITERKKTEEALRESELKLRSYFEFAPHGVFVANKVGKYIETNIAATDITGYTSYELCSMNQSLLIANRSLKYYYAHFAKAIECGFATDEFEIVRKDKTRGYCKVDTVKLSDERFLGFVVDITERKNAEETLKQSETFLRETQFIAQLGNCTIDIANGTWTSSEILDNILGISSEFDRSYKGWSKIVHPEWEKQIQNYFFNDVLKNKTKFNEKFKIIKTNTKEVRWVHAIGELKFDINNNPVTLICTIQDITERKNTAEALRKSESLYRSTLNTSPDAIIVTETDGRIRMISPVTLSLYGVDNESEIIGSNLFDYLIDQDIERAKSNFALMFDRLVDAVEYKIKKADGTTFFAEVKGDIIWGIDGQATGLVFIVRDITERKNAEIALKESQGQLKKFAAHLQNVREEERIMLAREIHDELGQILIAIKIDLGMTKQKTLKQLKAEDSHSISTYFDNLFGLVNDTINTTRKIMTDLRPEVLYMLGFVEAVKLYTTNFEKRHQITCLFENDIPNLVLNPQQTVGLYRIIQESLTNVARHSKATTVRIILNIQSTKLELEIIDNGIGFNDKQKSKHDSYGLIGMTERAFLLDGELAIKSQVGCGTSLKIELPYK